MIKKYFLLFLSPHNSMTYGAIFPLLITFDGGYYATDNVCKPAQGSVPYSFGVRRIGN